MLAEPCFFTCFFLVALLQFLRLTIHDSISEAKGISALTDHFFFWLRRSFSDDCRQGGLALFQQQIRVEGRLPILTGFEPKFSSFVVRRVFRCAPSPLKGRVSETVFSNRVPPPPLSSVDRITVYTFYSKILSYEQTQCVCHSATAFFSLLFERPVTFFVLLKFPSRSSGNLALFALRFSLNIVKLFRPTLY